MAGANQGGYVLGLILLLAFAWFWQENQPKWQRLLALVSPGLAGVMVTDRVPSLPLWLLLLRLALLWIQQGAWLELHGWKRGVVLSGLRLPL